MFTSLGLIITCKHKVCDDISHVSDDQVSWKEGYLLNG